MGEKSGGLWIIVIVIVLVGLLMIALGQIFPGALDVVKVAMLDMLNEAGIMKDELIGNLGGDVPPPEAE